MKNNEGKAYAKLRDLKVGDRVTADSGLTCIQPNTTLEVEAWPDTGAVSG